MHSVVVGAGITGVCTAYYLRQAGADVTVLESLSGVAQASSFGSAGLVAPQSLTPWAAPGMPWRMLSSIGRSQQALKLHPTLQTQFWSWFRQMRAASTPIAFEENLAQLHQLGSYSRACLQELREHHHLEYEQGTGVLHLFRSEREQKRAAPMVAWFESQKLPFAMLDAQACRDLEPSLAHDTPLLGGLWLPEDESGNCPLFTKQLRQLCQNMGVQFLTQHAVTQIETRPQGVTLHCAGQTIQADNVVIAAGQDSAALLAKLGIHVPMLPVTSYSATLNIKQELSAPRVALVDDAQQLSISRLGNRLRFTGLMRFAGGAPSVESKQGKQAIDVLVQAARDWLPAVGDYSRASYWAGTRAMLPEGLPLLGATSAAHVFVNTGHSGTGWTLACGAGKLLADVMTQHMPDIEMHAFSVQRFPLRKAAKQPKSAKASTNEASAESGS